MVLIENEDPAAAHDVRLSYAGYRPFPIAVAYTYARGSTSVRRLIASSGYAHLAPYSITELILRKT